MLKDQKNFSDLFGWNIEKVSPEKLPEGVEYWAITTTDHNGDNAVAAG